jgi:uncharacterized phage protein (TIGR01671 family)
MKQLRFRIWDVKQKKFIFEYEASHLRLAITLAGKVYRGEDDNILPESDYVIQQYTGLNDINDIEIYEGDIVKASTCNDDTEFHGPVVFIPDEGYYIDSEIERYDRILFDGGVSVGPKCEVIGNIFETPELLEQ